MRCSLSHQTGQLQSNCVKILMCYISLVQKLLIHKGRADRQTAAECYLLGSNSACSPVYVALHTTAEPSQLQGYKSQHPGRLWRHKAVCAGYHCTFHRGARAHPWLFFHFSSCWEEKRRGITWAFFAIGNVRVESFRIFGYL